MKRKKSTVKTENIIGIFTSYIEYIRGNSFWLETGEAKQKKKKKSQ